MTQTQAIRITTLSREHNALNYEDPSDFILINNERF